jgi:hypothetical protein
MKRIIAIAVLILGLATTAGLAQSPSQGTHCHTELRCHREGPYQVCEPVTVCR